MGVEQLPDDLLISILKKLPVKSLIKFLSVSKSWFSLITTPYFKSTYLHHTQIHAAINHRLFLRQSEDGSSPACVHRRNCRHSIWRNGGEETPQWIHGEVTPYPTIVAGSCNGLICLVNYYHRILCLWNPSIRKFLNLDPVPILKGDYYGNQAYGFGFDSLTNDYKVVVITHDMFKISRYYPWIYSMNSGNWRNVELPHSRENCCDNISDSCFSNGVIHWVFFRLFYDPIARKRKNHHLSLLTFDPYNESFGELKLPHEFVAKSLYMFHDLSLAVIDNSLVVLQNDPQKQEYCVWKMKEYGVDESWMILYTIKMSYLDHELQWDEYLLEMEYGKVFTKIRDGKLIMFNPKNQSSSSLVIAQEAIFDEEVFGWIQAFSYIESLELLDKRDNNHKLKDDRDGVCHHQITGH